MVNGRLAGTLIAGSRICSESRVRGDKGDTTAKGCIQVLRENDFDPLLLFFFDVVLSRVADNLGSLTSKEVVDALRTAHERSSMCASPAHVLESIGRSFYYLDSYDDCETVFTAILDRFGPDAVSLYYLGACNEIRGNHVESLAYYQKALRFEDCEDTRTGIQRVTAQFHRKESLSARPLKRLIVASRHP